LLLQEFYTIRLERQLVERIDFDLLFRWFVGLGMDDPVWDATTLTKNREAFGCAKAVAGLRKARQHGLPKTDWQFVFAMVAYNLVRLPRLLGMTAIRPHPRHAKPPARLHQRHPTLANSTQKGDNPANP
jgi:hypothetical protein